MSLKNIKFPVLSKPIIELEGHHSDEEDEEEEENIMINLIQKLHQAKSAAKEENRVRKKY